MEFPGIGVPCPWCPFQKQFRCLLAITSSYSLLFWHFLLLLICVYAPSLPSYLLLSLVSLLQKKKSTLNAVTSPVSLKCLLQARPDECQASLSPAARPPHRAFKYAAADFYYCFCAVRISFGDSETQTQMYAVPLFSPSTSAAPPTSCAGMFCCWGINAGTGRSQVVTLVSTL